MEPATWLRYFAVTLVGLVTVLAAGCGSSPSAPDDGGEPPAAIEAWNEHCELQLRAGAVFDSLAAAADTDAAILGTVEFLETEGDKVDRAVFNGKDGISIQYADGTKGILFFSGPPLADLAALGPLEERACAPRGRPTKDWAVIFSPFYSCSEDGFTAATDAVYEGMREELPDVGFSLGDIECYRNDEVTPPLLAGVSDAGVIHFHSHSSPWPSDEECDDIVMILSCPQSDWINEEYVGEDLVLVSTTAGSLRYGILPSFLAVHNDWGESQPIVWGGFCYSFLGRWPLEMFSAGVSCYLGWDWETAWPAEAEFGTLFYEHMCETPVADPFAATIAAYFARHQPSFTLVSPPEPPVEVHQQWAGDPFTTLQDPVPVDWIIGPFEPTFDWVAGAWVEAEDRLVVDFLNMNTPENLPMGTFEIQSGSGIEVNTSVIPDFIGFIMEDYAAAYNNLYWEDMQDSRPCYITFTELELEPLGKASGTVAGYVYDAYDVENIPVPISGTFTNVTIYPRGPASRPGTRTTTQEVLRDLAGR